ncbi:MAG: hypothetical protein ACPGR2_10235 [Psychrobium sp.]
MLLDCESKETIRDSLIQIFNIDNKQLESVLINFLSCKGLSLKEVGQKIFNELNKRHPRDTNAPLEVKWFHGTCLTPDGKHSIENDGLRTRTQMISKIKGTLEKLSNGITHSGCKLPDEPVSEKRSQGNEGPFAYLVNLNLTSDNDYDYTTCYESVRDYAKETVGENSKEQLIAEFDKTCTRYDVVFKSDLSIDKLVTNEDYELTELENRVIANAIGVLKFMLIDKNISTSDIYVFESDGIKINSEQILGIIPTYRETQLLPTTSITISEQIVSIEVPEKYRE